MLSLLWGDFIIMKHHFLHKHSFRIKRWTINPSFLYPWKSSFQIRLGKIPNFPIKFRLFPQITIKYLFQFIKDYLNPIPITLSKNSLWMELLILSIIGLRNIILRIFLLFVIIRVDTPLSNCRIEARRTMKAMEGMNRQKRVQGNLIL